MGPKFGVSEARVGFFLGSLILLLAQYETAMKIASEPNENTGFPGPRNWFAHPLPELRPDFDNYLCHRRRYMPVAAPVPRGSSLTWTSQSPQVTKPWRLSEPRKRTCEYLDGYRGILADNTPSLYLDRAALHFNSGHTTNLGQHTEITLQDIPKLKLTPSLFVENEERELEQTDKQTWALIQPLYVTCLLITCNL